MKQSKYISWFYSLSNTIRFLLILSMILVIAYIDYRTPAEFSARFFYLIPLFLSVWDGKGVAAGLYFSLICTILYFYSEFLQKNIHEYGFFLIWNYIIALAYFMSFVIIVNKLKKINLLLVNKNKELEITNNQKDKFFSIIAHDLRSPFQGFIGLTQAMAQDLDSFTKDELAEVSVELYKSSNNLYKLLENLLEWSRLQKGMVSFNPKDIVLSEAVSHNINLLCKRCEQKGIEIISELPQNQNVFADEEMLNSLLRNLLSNAVKFTKQGGKVTVKSRTTEDEMIEISVTDSGIGMPENLHKNLFKIGEKVGRKGTDGEETTGLGLLLCKDFVEMHSGRIWVESEEGKGSTFSFTLPRSK